MIRFLTFIVELAAALVYGAGCIVLAVILRSASWCWWICCSLAVEIYDFGYSALLHLIDLLTVFFRLINWLFGLKPKK